MKAVVLKGKGAPEKAFELMDWYVKDPKPGEVKVRVTHFGLNYADVVARLGMYQDCPPLPTVIGYEVVGHVAAIGEGVDHVEVGQRVVAFTRFGGYAEEVCTQADGVTPIADDMDPGEAVALATQYCTAWYAAEEMVRLHEGDQVLVRSAAGGVGTALVQLCKRRGCTVYGTTSKAEKIEYLKQIGVDVPINYREEKDWEVIKKHSPSKKLDVIFDAVGGAGVSQGVGMLDAGGRIVCYGAAVLSERGTNVIKTAYRAMKFGIYHPVQFMMSSKALIGVNMLRIADNKPKVLRRCLESVVDLTQKGELKPTVGGRYNVSELNKAHEELEFGQTIGKIVVAWD